MSAGVAHLKGLTKLRNLHLEYKLKSLRNLGLDGTKVPPDGLRAAKKALPEYNIHPAPPKE